MFASRNKAYVKADDAQSSREDRMTRLKFELREHIRFLADYEILGTDWLRMAESLHQIANVAFMETHLPPTEENPLLQHGKKGTGTLWDQERDELAIRILLEEGKLNLILRILHKYKQASRQGDAFEKQIKTTCEKFNSDVVTVTERCRVFEQSLGILLKFALHHVEALQIIDLPEFMLHVGEILDEANNSEKKQNNSSDAEKMQDTLVIHYLASIGVKLEDLDEDRVMDLAEQNNIIPTLISHLHKHYTWYKIETLEAASKFLSSAMASEPYGTEKNRFIRDTACIKQLVDLKGFFIHELVTVYGLKKKDVQTLLDELTRYERQVGPATIIPLKPKLSEAHGEVKIETDKTSGKKPEEEKKEAEKSKDKDTDKDKNKDKEKDKEKGKEGSKK